MLTGARSQFTWRASHPPFPPSAPSPKRSKETLSAGQTSSGAAGHRGLYVASEILAIEDELTPRRTVYGPYQIDHDANITIAVNDEHMLSSTFRPANGPRISSGSRKPELPNRLRHIQPRPTICHEEF